MNVVVGGADIELDFFELRLALRLGYTKSSHRLGMLLESWVGKTQVVAWVGLGTLVDLDVLVANEERQVPR